LAKRTAAGVGRYDLLEAETRGPFKSPRTFDSGGAPLHKDGQTVVKERIYLDKADRNILHDDVTVVDHALTRPWTVNKTYGREPNNQRPIWQENNCGEYNNHVKIGNEGYMLSADGFLMPAKKGQAPPDLRYFRRSDGDFLRRHAALSFISSKAARPMNPYGLASVSCVS
jgi:hypothetical protein